MLEELLVGEYDRSEVALLHDDALVDPHALGTKRLDREEGVAHEENRLALLPELLHLLDAFEFEDVVTDCEDLVDDEDVGIHAHAHREAEA